jgi:hypothetical protein
VVEIADGLESLAHGRLVTDVPLPSPAGAGMEKGRATVHGNCMRTNAVRT